MGAAEEVRNGCHTRQHENCDTTPGYCTRQYNSSYAISRYCTRINPRGPFSHSASLTGDWCRYSRELC